MNDYEINDGVNKSLEQRLFDYFSLYATGPEYKSTVQKRLFSLSAQPSLKKPPKFAGKLLTEVHYRPAYKWVAGLVLILLIFIALLAIQPVRASIERLIGYGYLEGAGFVRVSETYVLGGPVYSVKPDRVIGIDRVIADPAKTQVWLHVTGAQFTPEDVNREFFTYYLEFNGQKLPLNSYSWSGSKQEGIFEFGSLGNAISTPFTLHISPDWSIPIQLIPMSSLDQSQTTTIYPDLCQTHLEIELCLRAFVSNPTGYHLWLSASSKNPVFYLQTLEIRDPLTGEVAILMDSSGQLLNQIYSSEPPLVVAAVVPPEITDVPEKVSTTLSFERSTNESGSLDLLVTGLTGKTPADDTIVCELGNDPQIGDHFPCEKSITIAGEQIRFHAGEITQHSDGIHLTVQSDPIEASNGLQLTFVDAESLAYENSSFGGVGFDRRTYQLEIWQGIDSLNSGKKFAVKITSADLTMLEPFQLTWKIKP